MIKSSQPLSTYLQDIFDSGLDVGAFPTIAGNRYALRLVDPEDEETGLGFIAAFSSNLREADRPSDPKEQTRVNTELNEILHDRVKSAKYNVCFCHIDAASVAQFPDKYTKDDIGKSFVIIAGTGTAVSDAYRTYEEEKAVKRVSRNK